MQQNLVITENRPLDDAATNDDTSIVGEPSVAVDQDGIFVTGNWYAARSADSGASWTWVDPANTVPEAAGGFCCDQLTLFDQQRGIWIWILQYIMQNQTNVFRIAINDQAHTSTGGWYWWDIAPATLDGDWDDLWFDYPDAALGSDHLYVTFNMFEGQAWRRAAVMRFPLDTLANGGNLGFTWWSTTQNGSLRLTQQATPGNDMYWGSHNSSSQLRLFSWPADTNSISWWDIDVRTWSGGSSSTAPNGVNWLSRADPRITAATLGSRVITFMWTAGADSNRPNAYCRVVRIDQSSKDVLDEPDIWSSTRAWAYPAASVNNVGTVGFSAFYGGGDRNPGHVVGARDDVAGTWRVRYSRLGSDSPNSARWGDYINCRAASPETSMWVSSGFTLEGGSTRTDVLPRVVRFELQPAMADGVVPIQAGIHTIRQKSSGRLLDAYQSSRNDFRVVTRTAQHNDTQRWLFTPIGTVYTIQQKSSDRYMDAYQSSGRDFRVVTRTAQHNDTQRWVVLHVDGDQRAFTIQQLSSGRFLDAYQTSGNDFSVVTRAAQHNDTQVWVPTSVGSEPLYTIQQKSSDRYMDAFQSSGNDFGVVTRTAQNNDTQRWVFTAIGNVYEVQQVSSNRYVDAYQSSGNDFGVVTRTAQWNDTQRWVAIPIDGVGSAYTLQQLSSGRFLDAYQSSDKDFTVVTRAAQNNDTQRWIID